MLSSTRARCATAGLVLLLAACAPAALRTVPAPRQEVLAVIQQSAESWNRGDLDAWVSQYLDSPETTFAGRSGFVHGRAGIRELYRNAYWKDGPPRGRLRFDEVEVRALGPDHALAEGRYVLSDRDTGQQTATGLFSLVMVRTPQGWRVIHDHSS